MLLTGRLDRRIDVLYRADFVNSATGENIPSWLLFKRLPAQKVVNGTAERVIGAEVVSASSVVFKVRYREDVTARMKIRFDDVIYQIKGIYEAQGGRYRESFIVCTVEEPQDARSN
jgi:SPP1 family predicted phage head-tail adaptor